MRLTFKQPYLSITELQEIDLPDFTVLTGVNGSGKSHLLQAIEQKKIFVDGHERLQIVRFNYETFRLENESAYNAQQLLNERQAAYGFFTQQLRDQLNDYRQSNLGDQYGDIVERCVHDRRPLWTIENNDRVTLYKQNVTNLFTSTHIRGNVASLGIFDLAQRLPKSVDDLTEEQFLSLYKPYSIKQDFLPNALGKVIWDYYTKYRENRINEFENEKYGRNYPFLTDIEFEFAHGSEPWEVINKILKTFSGLDYRVNSPEGLSLYSNYQLKLVHTTRPDLEIEFSSLSSGERTLMALVASVYKTSCDNQFPDVLLLDELDASLHPSMVKSMLNVIESIFCDRGVRVILVTHSPTTIALCPDESIFVMNKSGKERIEKRTKRDALSILTEGYATLEEGLSILDNVARNQLSIISEGKNVTFIKRALELNKVRGATIVEGAEAITGASQLRTLFDFFQKVKHENKVLFVWDCDATQKIKGLVSDNKTFAFLFSQNAENVLAKNGIENLFPTHLFDGFKKTIRLADETVLAEFDEAHKRRFEAHVLENGTLADFAKFQPLVDRIKELLSTH